MPIKLKVKFSVEKRRIVFFKNFLGIKTQKDVLKQAYINLVNAKHNWDINKRNVEKIINSVFKGYSFGESIKISIFPTNFHLGASETKKHLVLFGQPIRSKNFSSAIILHEITHILLSKIKIEREIIIDEVICYLVEEIIYSSENKHIEDIWKKRELDAFHLRASEIAIKYRDKIIYKNIDVKYLIFLFKKNLPKQTLKITPSVGLLANLKAQN